MIEFKGWINLRFYVSDEINSSEFIRKGVVCIQERLKEFNSIDNQFIDIKDLNGFYSLFIGGCHNHDVGYSDSIKNVLNEITKLAKRSYGLVYVRFLEDTNNYNKFLVYKLANGLVTIEEDSLLSPCDRRIED